MGCSLSHSSALSRGRVWTETRRLAQSLSPLLPALACDAAAAGSDAVCPSHLRFFIPLPAPRRILQPLDVKWRWPRPAVVWVRAWARSPFLQALS